MITYFNLHSPESEALMADDETYTERACRPCPITTAHLDGERRKGPLSLRLKHTNREELIIWSWVEGQVVHESVLECFEKQGFTGYRTQPATVRFADGFVSRDYRELVVTGWAGVAQEESGVRVKESCPACHWKHYTGIQNYEKLIDWSQWTGDDFFIVWPLPRYILITERVAMFLLGAGFKSFALKSLDDFDKPAGRKGFSVASLSNFLPDDLAIKYGAPLGLE